MNDIDNIIKIADKIARPWKIFCGILSILLGLCLYYIVTAEEVVTFTANDNTISNITQSK